MDLEFGSLHFGRNGDNKGYKLWCPKISKVIISRDVIFYETAMLNDLPSKDLCDKGKHSSSLHEEL